MSALTAHLSPDDQLRLGGDIQRRLGIKTVRDESLARFTTMRVGGRADLFAEVRNPFELRAIARFTRSRDIPLFVIGRGSNLVISDAGIAGLVIVVRAAAQRVEGTRLVADAGLPMAKAATIGREAGLSGLEFGLAIPGTVGGAVWANAGAHGSDVAARLVEASVIGPDGSEARVTPDDLVMTYRETRLKHHPPGVPEIVTQAVFELEPAAPELIAERLDEIRRWRQAHQPVGQKSAGSVFRNPEGGSAGQLIDELGLKGRSEGGAVVSPRHANFIVNQGGATASDVRRLAQEVRRVVREERGVALEFEIEFAGDWGEPGEWAA